ncbi:uncharacterized protein LOC131880102 isoform X2 [Tigriopus californicus]|uniref:uncharacterized protein LOC131880102 isoform X2 n=1 Tax=Tigriopus californicus TaxID=6832 RepID=UPI0027DA80BC|nr:uncharacterized protein LOC131880102 isoform X2 [Tigriopus californicus]|eukprot:TCALIF_05646-PA protein Name:"Similar to RFX7 DNA-binding protein RFX7 (Homo sapiens)" AED:0.23 eAED:0.23 QI:138/0.85/0.75/1/1/1/8/0/979
MKEDRILGGSAAGGGPAASQTRSPGVSISLASSDSSPRRAPGLGGPNHDLETEDGHHALHRPHHPHPAARHHLHGHGLTGEDGSEGAHHPTVHHPRGEAEPLPEEDGHHNPEADHRHDNPPLQLEPLRQLLAESLSSCSKAKVSTIVATIEDLNKFERLLLYLDLPASQLISDPLRQPMNPLGSRSEIQMTITWIRTHLEEDPQVSLPKHEVYDEYMDYCNDNELKALSTADFGKVMKQVYPQVRPRRLGTRGNSRYCYAGLKKRVKLEEPFTPEFSSQDNNPCGPTMGNTDENMAATNLVLEWAEKVFNEKIQSIGDLASYLVDNMQVDNRNVPLNFLNPPKRTPHTASDMQDIEMDHLNSTKLEEPDEIGKKRPSVECNVLNEMQSSVMNIDTQYHESKRKKFESDMDLDENNGLLSIVEGKNSFNLSSMNCSTNVSSWNTDKIVRDSKLGESGLKRDEDEIKDYFSDQVLDAEESSNHDKLSQLRQLLEKNLKPDLNVNSSNSAFRPASHGHESNGRKMQSSDWNSSYPVPGVTSTSSSSDTIVTANGSSLSQRRRVSFNPLVVQDTGSASMGQQDGGGGVTTIALAGERGTVGLTSSGSRGEGGIVVTGMNSNSSAVQPSPGTRKRHFSFQPISPRQNSLPQSPTASPFISPRSTPVPTLMRSRHSSGSALPLHLLPQASNKIFGSSSSDISRAATFGSTSECSTPFISPHGTPIPFNRSRHNSAQGRLCRSRHSSGLGTYGRYNNAFSPMALNNLNNPYSPQPSTPLAVVEDPMPLPPTSSNGNVITQNIMGQFLSDHQRSRHSSAESEPALRTNQVFYDDGSKSSFDGVNNSGGNGGGFNTLSGTGGGRHRHASAGQAQTSSFLSHSFENDPWCGLGNTANDTSLKLTGEDQSNMIYSELNNESTGGETLLDVQNNSIFDDVVSGGLGEGSRKDLIPDDLDIALSALKDCDTDYSKYVEDREQQQSHQQGKSS